MLVSPEYQDIVPKTPQKHFILIYLKFCVNQC